MSSQVYARMLPKRLTNFLEALQNFSHLFKAESSDEGIMSLKVMSLSSFSVFREQERFWQRVIKRISESGLGLTELCFSLVEGSLIRERSDIWNGRFVDNLAYIRFKDEIKEWGVQDGDFEDMLLVLSDEAVSRHVNDLKKYSFVVYKNDAQETTLILPVNRLLQIKFGIP